MPKWIRVRDTSTGHTFDLDARAVGHRPGVEPVNDPDRWPDIEGPRAVPRPAKPFVGKDGRARARPGSSADDSTDTTPDAGDQQPRARRTKTTSTPAAPPADTEKEQK